LQIAVAIALAIAAFSIADTLAIDAIRPHLRALQHETKLIHKRSALAVTLRATSDLPRLFFSRLRP
jgi:hypothetical protein